MVYRSSFIRAFMFAALSAPALVPTTAAWAGPDACTSSPVGTLTCTGNQQDGIAAAFPPYDTLIVKDLTAPIAPAAGTRGISFDLSSVSNITLDADLGSQGITTHNAHGVYVAATTGDGANASVAVSVTGNVSADGVVPFSVPIAIFATTGDFSSTAAAVAGSVAVTSRGNVTSGGDGIAAGTSATWSELVSLPIAAEATSGDVTVHAENVSAQGRGILAESVSDVTVNSNVSGEVRSGNVEVRATGDVVSAADDAISATSMALISTDGPSVWASTGNVTVDVNNVTTLAAHHSAVKVFMHASARAAAQRLGAIGTATVTTRGEISARASGGIGIFVHNIYDDISGNTINYGDYEVNVLSGSSVTGGPGGYGIFAEGTGTITNYGSISAPAGTAIASTFTPTIVENYGVITGDVGLSLGANTFNNHASGLFNIGNSAYVGTGTLTNDGVLSPHGAGTLGTSTITGNFVQSGSATYAVDVDGAASPAADLLNVTGSAGLAGTVVALAKNLALAPQEFLILSVAGGATDNGATAKDTAAVDYGLRFDANGNDVYLTTAVDFRGIGGGLNRNQNAIGTAINAIAAGGTPAAFQPITNALLTLPTMGSLANAYDQLSPEVYNYAKIDTLFAAEQFSADLMSCNVEDTSGYAFIREGQCIWARARARVLDLDTTRESIGADTTVGSFSGGAQLALAPDWRLGFAAGYDNVSLDTHTGASSSGDRGNLGSVLKYNPGPWLLAGSVSGGWTRFDTERNMAFGGFAGSASSDSDVDYVAGRLHAAYLIDAGSWYAMPMVSGTATRLDFGGAGESGGNGAALNVAGDGDTVLAITPAVEFGTEVGIGAGTLLRPFVRAGVTWRNGDDLALSSAFSAAPAAAFATVTALDEVLADVSAGFDLINAGGAVLRLQYDGRYGEETQQSSASLKGSVPF